VDRLGQYLNRGQARGPAAVVVHRLDRDTSGLLVFARRPDVATRLIRQFAEHHPDRQYVALAAGVLTRDRDTIRTHLSTDRALNQRSGPEGDLAITHLEVQRRYRDVTVVAVRLETGQRNQIRVHLAELGHPVLGDTRYRPDLAAHPAWPYRRIALHARSLGFTHPVTGRPLRLEAEVPREMRQAEEVLRRG
jgi:23S rRNA pseudouridine1911/1915/1917 synthase